jgi:hypothetical protein
MPRKVFYLDDRRAHSVFERDFREFSVLETEPGPRLVVAKGTVQGVNVDINVGIRLRLEVHSILSGLIGFDETEFFTQPANIGPGGVVVTAGNSERNSFMLVVAANMPFGGVGVSPGEPPPPPNRAVFLARRTVGDPAGVVTNLKIISLPVDEIVATVLN